jgi:hypothetical protein
MAETVTITEKISCDSKCMSKYKDKDGTFKGGKGKAFENCESGMKECCTGVSDASALCAAIAKKTGKA